MSNKKYIFFSIFYLVFSFLLVIFINIFFKTNFIQYKSINKIPTKNINKDELNNKTKYEKNLFSYNVFKSANAYLTIPIIKLYNAPIKNGTSQEIMKKYIGHFENTSFDKGNIGLASHNRGMGANYFENINKLSNGDVIFYTYENIVKKYKVNKKVVIDSYDWSNLEETSKNTLTLITCIENYPNLRLCIQAIQI